jgi:hypothetical protein
MNNSLLSDHGVTEEITGELKIPRTKWKSKYSYHNLWNTGKAVMRKKIITNDYRKK